MSPPDYQDLYEHAPVGYLLLHPDGRIIGANATFAAWSGYAPGSLAGKSFQDLLTVGTRILYETTAAPQLRISGRFSEVAVELRTASGETLPVFAHATLHQELGSTPALFRLVLTQAFGRRRYERELVDSRATATAAQAETQGLLLDERKSSELREQFIAVLGHDLRNPLASIAGGLGLLIKMQPSEKGEKLLRLMTGSVQRMNALIDNMLDFARGRLGGGLALEHKTQLLKPILVQVIDELRVAYPDRAIETRFDLDEPVYCDGPRLSQLFSNLLGNAVTHGAANQPIRIEATNTTGQLTLSVANAGKKIAPEALKNLFRPFHRGEVKSGLQGLGLGLFIASEIAKAHGGDIGVTSTDKETKFTLTMPAQKGAS